MKMSFKIVQTIEKGKTVLSCVPQQWERDGILYWPRKQHHVKKLQRNEGSQPDETWHQFNCILKRRNIQSYHDGTNEIDIMSNNSETDDNYANEVVKKKRKCVEVPQQSFNILAEECLTACSQITVPENSSAPLTENFENYVVLNQSDQYVNEEEIILEEQPDFNSLKKDMETIKKDIKTMKDDIKTMKEMQTTLNSILVIQKTSVDNQGVIHETLNTALLKMTEMQVQFENFIKKSISEKTSNEVGFKPVKDLKELKEFEERLNDSNYRQDLQNKLGILCTKGAGHGTTNAYAIVDLIFERNFLKSCSWTGVSRSQTTCEEQAEPDFNLEASGKICFKSFTRIINFFFGIIHKSDELFTFPECRKFFKTILRNAVIRCNKIPKRASAKKTRAKANNKDHKNKDQKTEEPHPSSSQQPLLDQQIDIQQDDVHNVSEEEVLDLK